MAKRDFHDNLVAPAATIRETLRIIDGHGVPIGLVHDAGRLIGTVTDGDIRRGLLSGITLDAPVTEVMNPQPVAVLEGTADVVVLKLMQARSILFVPVVDGRDRIVDLKIQKDMLRAADEPPVDDARFPTAAAPMDNPVMIMAGGEGRRLRPLTEDRPKPMVEVGGRPILESIVERFVAQGFARLYIAVNYRREVIENYFGDGQKWGARITYIHEDWGRGTVAALGSLPETETRPVVVMNGDILTRVDFRHLVAFHDQEKASATMAVSEIRFAVPYGVVTTEGTRLAAMEEKPVKSFFVNAGIYVIAPETIDLIRTPALRDHQINMNNLFSTLLARARDGAPAPVVFPLREYWIDVGRTEDLAQAEHDLRTVVREI